MSEQFEATSAAWLCQARALDQLDDSGLGLLCGMARHWRATLPAECVVLVGWLDAVREQTFAMLADRQGVTVEEIKALIAVAMAGGVEDNG